MLSFLRSNTLRYACWTLPVCVLTGFCNSKTARNCSQHFTLQRALFIDFAHIFTALIPREVCPGINCSNNEFCEITSFNPLGYGCRCKNGFVQNGKSCTGKSCYNILSLIFLKKQISSPILLLSWSSKVVATHWQKVSYQSCVYAQCDVIWVGVVVSHECEAVSSRQLHLSSACYSVTVQAEESYKLFKSCAY